MPDTKSENRAAPGAVTMWKLLAGLKLCCQVVPQLHTSAILYSRRAVTSCRRSPTWIPTGGEIWPPWTIKAKPQARWTWSITAAAGARASAASWIKIRVGDPGRRQIEPPGAPIQTQKRVRGDSCPRQFVASCLSGVQNLDAGSSSQIAKGTMVESSHRATTW